jgi:uncharacterized protein (UPF0248 family)
MVQELFINFERSNFWLVSLPSKILSHQSFIHFQRLTYRLGLEARITKLNVQIWPQRLVSSEATPTDDMYEGFMMIGLQCSDADIPLAEQVSDRWKIQVEEDTPLQGECFIVVTIYDKHSMIEKDKLKPCTRVWPQPVVKPEENRSKEKNDPEESKKSKRIFKSPAKSPEKAEDSKGAKLRQAIEVLNRIRHDREYNIDDCVVGYKDRHIGKIQEKPAADWIMETTHEEFIPQHRIEFIRKGGDVIWDKKARVDKVFGSG